MTADLAAGPRVAFMLPDAPLPAWQRVAIERLIAGPGVQPVAWIAPAAGPPVEMPALYRRCASVAARAPALHLGPLPPALRSLPRYASLEEGMTMRPDIVLCLAAPLPPAPACALPRYGTWMFAFGPRGSRSGIIPGIWELAEGELVTEGALIRLGSAPDAGAVLRRGAVRTVRATLGGTAEALTWRMAEWPLQLCAALCAGDEPPSATEPLELTGVPPGPGALLRALGRVAAAPVARLLHTLFRHDHWNVGLVRAPISSFLERPVPGPVEWLPAPPRGTFLADPFGVRRGDRLTLVCEQLTYARGTGCIVAIEWPNADAPMPVGVGVSSHRSYPYLLQADGDTWCIPETHEAREVVLHRAVDFPGQWRREQVLLQGVAAVDATPFQHDGRWWLALADANVRDHENLFLWHAPALRGPWQPHAANPVKTDPRSSRPAGTPFRHEGALYRPAQDCSSEYGRRVAINRVRVLTPHRYEEEPVAWVGPDTGGAWPNGLHTLSAVGDWTLIDSKRVTFSLAAAVANFRAMVAKSAARGGVHRGPGEMAAAPQHPEGDMQHDAAGAGPPPDVPADAPAVRPRRIGLLVRVILTLACVALLVRQVDLSAMLPLLRQVNPWWLGAAILVLTLDRILQGAKWYPLLRVQTTHCGPGDAILATIAAYPASILLPSGASEVLRALMLGRAHGNVTEIGASVVMERILGLLAMLLANLAAVIAAYEVSRHASDALPAAIATVVVGFAALGLLFTTTAHVPMPRWALRRSVPFARTLKRFVAAVRVYRGHLGTVGIVLVLSGIEVFVVSLAMWCCAEALGTSIDLGMMMIATPITLFLTRIPLTVWGIGVTEGAFAFVLALLYGVPAAESVAALLTMRFMEICVALPALIFWRQVGMGLRPARSDAVSS